MTRFGCLRGAAAVLLALVIVVGCRGRKEAPAEQGASKPAQPSVVETRKPNPESPAATRTGTPEVGKDRVPSPSETSASNALPTGVDAGRLPASNPFINLTTEKLRAKMDDLTREEQAAQQRVAELKQKWSEGNAPADTNDAIREADYRALNERMRAVMVQRTLLQRAMDLRSGQ